MWKLENLAIKKNSILIFQLKFACRNLDIALSLNCPKKFSYAVAVAEVQKVFQNLSGLDLYFSKYNTICFYSPFSQHKMLD